MAFSKVLQYDKILFMMCGSTFKLYGSQCIHQACKKSKKAAHSDC